MSTDVDFAAARSRQFKRHVRDALDFQLAVAHGVDCYPMARSALGVARFAEVDASQKFAHNHDVRAAHDFRPQRGSVFERGKANRRPQVGKHAQFPPQAQQSSLRPQMTGKAVECRAADCAQQHRPRGQAGLECVGRQGIIVGKKGRAPNRLARDIELMAENFCDGFQYADGFVGNFRSDAVAGNSGDIQEHGLLLYGKTR